jgi:N-acetylglucosamine malate deacetylase 2
MGTIAPPDLAKGGPRVLSRCGRNIRALVLAAHPDDETIGCGGLLGWDLDTYVAYLTDGVPHDAALVPERFRHDRDGYRRARRTEAERALARAGLGRERIVSLGGVDQETSFEMVSCVRRFVDLLEALRPELILTHPYEGGHPDHDTATFVARAGSRLVRSRWGLSPVVLEMTSYHAGANALVTGRFLDDGDERYTLRFSLSPADRLRKEEMLRCFETQRDVLAPFSVEEERFRRAPAYDFSSPPHPGALYYEKLGWPMTGEAWRKLCAEARRTLFAGTG